MGHHFIPADFNGLLADDLLCLSHEDRPVDRSGQRVELRPGQIVTAYEEDLDEANQPCWLVATGRVETSPDFAKCRGSRWSLRMDARGIRHEAVGGGPKKR